ncbi:MAG: hypothetical protein OXS35_06855, partial [Dehalococcoidia bacterium]|nr:hypothetical protein [Dehalococcoidia bacterium]
MLIGTGCESRRTGTSPTATSYWPVPAAYLDGDEERPVRWSTVASWTGRTVHPLMQFERIAGL